MTSHIFTVFGPDLSESALGEHETLATIAGAALALEFPVPLLQRLFEAAKTGFDAQLGEELSDTFEHGQVDFLSISEVSVIHRDLRGTGDEAGVIRFRSQTDGGVVLFHVATHDRLGPPPYFALTVITERVPEEVRDRNAVAYTNYGALEIKAGHDYFAVLEQASGA